MPVPPPILEVFYASTCTPCRLELPVLAQVQRAGTALRIVIISDPDGARRDLAGAAPQLSLVAVVPAHAAPRTILHEAGDADGILPYARAVAPDRRICASWRGILTVSRVNNMLAGCAHLSAPPRRRS